MALVLSVVSLGAAWYVGAGKPPQQQKHDPLLVRAHLPARATSVFAGTPEAVTAALQATAWDHPYHAAGESQERDPHAVSVPRAKMTLLTSPDSSGTASTGFRFSANVIPSSSALMISS